MKEHEYTPRGCTRKPCAGCGEPGMRPIDKVCSRCATAIKRGHEAVERERAAVEKVPYFTPRLSTSDRDNDRYFTCYDLGDGGNLGYHARARAAIETIDAVAIAFAHVVRQIAETQIEPVHDVSFYTQRLLSNRQVSYDRGQWLRYTPAVRDALDALDQAIRAAIRTAYDAGKQDGARLLDMLASGEITVASLNKQTLNAKE